MRILVACEESQAVTTELRALGHEAFSCDIQECSGGHPEWHILGDALKLINGNCSFKLQNGERERERGKWDMIIAFPPCTHLAVSGAKHFEKKRENGEQRFGVWFFCQFLKADCERIAIENPVGIISGEYVSQWYPDLAKKYGIPVQWSQQVQPWQHGDAYEKTTCLWLKNLPKLVPTNVVKPPERHVIPNGRTTLPEWYSRPVDENGKRVSFSDKATAKYRSKTPVGLAKAMANQWTTEEARSYKSGWISKCSITESVEDQLELDF